MAELSGENDDKLDLVPMIDTIMLLLFFFILTTKFAAEEKVISSILPSDKGQGPGSPSTIEKPDDVNVVIVPEGYGPNEGVRAKDERWRNSPVSLNGIVRISGNQATFVLDGKLLKQKPSQEQADHLEKFRLFVEAGLQRFETRGAGDPNTAAPKEKPKIPAVVIHCFSGLEYKYALVAYDAVRAYEARYSGSGLSSVELAKAREVNFAPPRIRQYHTWELGYELDDLFRLK